MCPGFLSHFPPPGLKTPLELMMVLPFIRMGEWIFLVHEPLPFSAEKLASMLASDFFASIFALGESSLLWLLLLLC